MRLNLAGIEAKLVAAAMLFVLPVGVLASALVHEHGVWIAFARSETAGVAALRALSGAQLALERARLDGAGLKDDTAEAAVRLAGEALPVLAEKAEQTAKVVHAASNPAKVARARTELRDLIAGIGDNSKLILDPVLDSYYLTDVVLSRLPDALDQVVDLQLAPRGSEAERIALAQAAGTLQAVQDGMDASVNSAVAGNADGLTEAAVRPTQSAANKAMIYFLRDVQAGPLPAARATALLDALASFQTKAQDELGRLIATRIAGMERTELIDLGGAGLLFALCGITVLILARRQVFQPLRRLTAAMSVLAEGNLDVTVPDTKRRGELGALATSMAVFKANSLVIRRVEQADRAAQAEKLRRQEALTALARDFSSAVGTQLALVMEKVNGLNAGAVTLAATAEQTSRGSDTVQASSGVALQSTQAVAAATEQLAATGSEIGRQVELAATRTRHAAEESATARRTVLELTEVVDSISEVAALIQEIAARTNLLALNATIEAARAGEAGRGFAVVASEVKALANQTSRAVENVQARVGAVHRSAAETGAIMARVTEAVSEVNEAATAVAAAVTQQTAATAEITRNVQRAAGMSETVAANITDMRQGAVTTRETASMLKQTVQELSSQTHELRDEIEGFLEAMGRAGERRRSQRKRADIPATLRWGNGRQTAGQIMDLSVGGCAVACDLRLATGEQVEIEFGGQTTHGRVVTADGMVTRLQFATEMSSLQLAA